jgi:hypothetical protein
MSRKDYLDRIITHQEAYVTQRKKDPDMHYLRYGLFRDGYSKYTVRQIEGYLREEYHHTRKHNSYILDDDLVRAGTVHPGSS